MVRIRGLRLALALPVVLGLACTPAGAPADAPATAAPAVSSEDPSHTDPASSADVPARHAGAVGADAGPLRIGGVLPLSGDLAALGPGLRAAMELAADEVNAAGGVLGARVELVVVDSGDGWDTDAGTAAAQRLLAEGVNAVVGPLGSSWSVLAAQLAEQGIFVLSPGAGRTGFADPTLIGRLALPDAVEGRALARAIADEGATSVAILARSDDYGQDIAQALRQDLADVGLRVVADIPYHQTAEGRGWIIDEILPADPDVIVHVGFDEVTTHIELLVGAGAPADVHWVTGGTDIEALPAGLVGVRGTRPSRPPDLGGFVERLGVPPPDPVLSHAYALLAAATYDAAVLIALAAEAAGVGDGDGGRVEDEARSEHDTEDEAGAADGMSLATPIAGALSGLTQPGGERCSRPAECLSLARAGARLTYEGALGPRPLGQRNEPEGGVFELLRATEDGRAEVTGTLEVAVPAQGFRSGAAFDPSYPVLVDAVPTGLSAGLPLLVRIENVSQHETGYGTFILREQPDGWTQVYGPGGRSSGPRQTLEPGEVVHVTIATDHLEPGDHRLAVTVDPRDDGTEPTPEQLPHVAFEVWDG